MAEDGGTTPTAARFWSACKRPQGGGAVGGTDITGLGAESAEGAH